MAQKPMYATIAAVFTCQQINGRTRQSIVYSREKKKRNHHLHGKQLKVHTIFFYQFVELVLCILGRGISCRQTKSQYNARIVLFRIIIIFCLCLTLYASFTFLKFCIYLCANL